MFAHASGFNWDEGLLVLAPITLVLGLLMWARRRQANATPAISSDDRTR